MKYKNKIYLFTIIIITLITIVLSLKINKSSYKNKIKNKSDFSFTSNELIKKFKNNQENAKNLYSDKIIEVSGKIKEISYLNNKTTIILKSENIDFGVICELNPLENIKKLEKNKTIRIKGICKGYLKDVILLNCSIE